MAWKDGIENSIALFLMEVKKKYRIKVAYVYGSHAKGCAGQWSDVDIAIISPDFSDNLYETRLELMRIAVRIDDRLEPRPFKDESFNVNDPFVADVRDHGIPFPVI